jgi:type II secretory pathway pseudopilin PulG
MSRLRHDESGFTLVELLVTLSIGMVIMAAILGLLDLSVRSSASSLGRQQAVRDARAAADRIGQELRLASCPATGTAIMSATDDSVSYYVSRPQSDYRLAPVVERHTLTYDATGGTVTLTVSPRSGTATPIVWSATPSRTTTLASGLSRTGSQPIFEYRGYDAPTDSVTTAIAAPVDAASFRSIAQVRLTFTALGAYPSAEQGSSRFQSTIALRTDDPSDQDNTPEC